MNEGLNLPQQVRVNVMNPVGQQVVWTGQVTSRGSSLLQLNRIYHPIAFHVTKTQVFVKLLEIPNAWYEASAFEEWTARDSGRD